MQNKTISFEAAEAAVMQTWKSLLKQTNPYLVPILLPMIEHFKPLFQEFYDLGVSHGRTAQAVPDGFVLVNKKDLVKVLNCVTDDWLVDTDSFEEFKKIESLVQDEVNAMIEAQEPAND